MAFVMKDRVMELSTTTGSGALTLAGAYTTGFRAFSSVMSNADTTRVFVEAVDANANPSGDWFVGPATYSSGTLTLGTPEASSTGSAITWAAGNKRVVMDASAAYLASLTGTTGLLPANNLSDVSSAATSRTNLGATTIGANLFTLTNPSAITFPRYNADNSVSALTASAFRTAIGAGTGTGDLVSTNNLSDVASASSARTNLGLAIGTNVQAYNLKLATIAANTVSSQTGTAYTAVLADADTYIQFSNASAISFTIPQNSSVAFPIGTVIEVEQAGAGALTIVAGTGTTLNSRAADLTLAGQYSVAFVKKVATNTWTVNGDL